MEGENLTPKLPNNIQEKIIDYTQASNMTETEQTCLIIDDGEHLEMIEKVIGCISPMANLSVLDPNDSYEQILKNIQKTSEKTKKPVIVNFSGDFATEYQFLLPNNDFFNDFNDAIGDFFEIQQENKDINSLFKNLQKLKNQYKNLRFISFLDKLMADLGFLLESPKHGFTKLNYNVVEGEIKKIAEKLKSDIQTAEFNEKILFIEKTKKDFYQKVAHSPGLFVFSIGNRWASSNDIINRIFSPLRASFDKEEFVNNAIFVVNVTNENTIQEKSETPSNDGRGDFPIGEDWLPVKNYSNGAIQNNPLQPFDNIQLRRLQEATLSVKGQWHESSGVNGTSAAAATLSGFLVLLQQRFPPLTKYQLREAVLYSAVKEFDVPQEAFQPDRRHKLFRKGTLKEKKVKINNAWYRSDNQASPSFYGQGLFDAKRALKYAEELSKLSTSQPYKSWFHQLHTPEKRREKFNTQYNIDRILNK